MHLLFATSLVPDGSLGSGYEIANAAIIDALRRAGARVTVLGYCWPGRKPAEPDATILLGEVDVRTDGASPLQKAAWLMRAVSAGKTFASVKLTDAPAAEVRAAMDRAGPFDAYVLNAAQFAGAYLDLFGDRPKLFVAHNVEYRSAAQNAEASAGGFQRLLYRREARLLRVLEERICREAAFVYTLAEEDRSELGVASDDRSVALPLVIRSEQPAAPADRQIECHAALIGTWTWQPNLVGLEWFLNEVTPHLSQDFRIRIAGHVPAHVVSPHPGVSFVGRVPDALAFVRSAAVIPLVSQVGTGVQLKTIETFENGLPSVATSSSLRGIDHIPENCIREDDPTAFAAALTALARKRGADVDGRAFYHQQRAELDKRIRIGLDRIAAANAGRERSA